MSYAIIRNEKYKRDNLKGIYRHNERRNKNYSNKSIDKTKSYLNCSIKCPQYSYEALKYQLEKDAEEPSYYFDISDRSFRKFNSSAYKYNPKKKRFEIDKKLTVSVDVPKIVY